MAITVTNNVPNTSYELNGKKLTLTANDGYKFEYAPTYYVSVFDNGDMTVSADGKTATVTLMSTNGSVTLDGSTVADEPPQPKEWNVINYIPNTSFAVENDIITVTADIGYKFDEAPEIAQGSFLSAETELNADGKTATFDLSGSNFDIDTPVIIIGEAVIESEPEPDPSGYTIINEVEHTDFDITGDILTLTAEQGYKFETAPTANNFADPHVTLYDKTATTAVLTDDNKQAVFDFSTSETGVAFNKKYAITLQGSVVVDSEQGDLYGSINVYNLTEKSLRTFAEKRFMENVDLGDYVVKLFRLFAPVGETKDAVLTCGNYNLHIEAQTPVKMLETVDFGTVTVPRHNNSTADNNSEISVFVPFVGFVKIDNVYLGKPVNLKYEVNKATGEAVVLLSSDGVVFDVKECKLKTDMLYKTSNNNTFGNDNFDSRFLYGFKPFVKMVWYESLNNFINNVDCQRLKIGDVSGFARITEVNDLQSEQMTADERLLIMNQLNTGVYVEQN